MIPTEKPTDDLRLTVRKALESCWPIRPSRPSYMASKFDEEVNAVVAALVASAPQEPDALIAELRKYATGDSKTEYGRGWNCAMEEAESIIRRLSPKVAQEPVADDDALRDEMIAAYKQGALDVHEAWIEGCGEENAPSRDPDFTEAAHDYASDRLQAKAPETGEE